MKKINWIRVLLITSCISTVLVDNAAAKKKKSKTKKPSADKCFKSPDLDEDGRISSEEFDSYMEWPMEEFYKRSGVNDNLDKSEYGRLNSRVQVSMFNNVDTDRDGKISIEEYEAAHKKELSKKYKVD